MSEVLFKTEKLSKSYVSGHRTVNALEEVDLVIRRGEFVAITGHSGSWEDHALEHPRVSRHRLEWKGAVRRGRCSKTGSIGAQ